MFKKVKPGQSKYDAATHIFKEANPVKDFQYLISFMMNDLYVELPTNTSTLMMIEISYVPRDYCIVVSEYDAYFESVFRTVRIESEEAFTAQIVQDFIRIIAPVFVEVTCHFNFCGGEKVIKASANVKQDEPIRQSEEVIQAAKELEELRQQMSPDEFKETLLKNQDLIKILSEEEKKKSESIQKIFELPDEPSLEPEED